MIAAPGSARFFVDQRDYLDEFEHIVLLAVLRLSNQAYGVTVRQEIWFNRTRNKPFVAGGFVA